MTDWREIVASNLRSCELECLIVSILIPMLSLAAKLVYRDWTPTLAHLSVLLVAVAMTVGVHVLRPRLAERPRAALALCLFVEATLLAFAVAIDTVYSDGSPGVFVQSGSIALTVVLVTPYSLSILVAACAEVACIALTLAYKPIMVARYDIFACVVSFVLALAVSQVVMTLRLRDFSARERYRELSRRDALCGIYNKGAIVAITSSYFSVTSPHSVAAVLLIDIDFFKMVNDKHGHYLGDEVLRGMGETLLALFRTTDSVGRFGGDEFMVFAEGLVNEGVIERKAAELQARTRALGLAVTGEEITCSMGILIADDAAVTYKSMMRQVDAALYESKRSGRARATIRHYVPDEGGRERREHAEGMGGDRDA